MLIYVCDDENSICDKLQKVITQNYPDIQTETFQDILSLKSALNNVLTPPMMILMDICLDDNNGIDFVKSIRKKLITIPVVFITGFTEYCQDIFMEFKPFGLLTKPIDEEKLFYYINKAIDKIHSEELSVTINHSRKNITLKNSEIYYIESEKRKIRYFTKDICFEEYIKIDDALKKLVTGFLRCHKSFAVNLQHIATLNKDHIITKNNKKIPVSRSYRNSVENAYLDYISEKIGG